MPSVLRARSPWLRSGTPRHPPPCSAPRSDGSTPRSPLCRFVASLTCPEPSISVPSSMGTQRSTPSRQGYAISPFDLQPVAAGGAHRCRRLVYEKVGTGRHTRPRLLLLLWLCLRLRHGEFLIGAEQAHLYTSVLGARRSIPSFVSRFFLPQSDLLDPEHRYVMLRDQISCHVLGPPAAQFVVVRRGPVLSVKPSMAM